MVDFELTDEQRLMQKTAHEFAEREMRPLALEYDRKGTVPWEIIRKAHALGLDTAFIPEAYGGGGVDSTLTHVVVTEELNWGCAGMATGLIGAGLAYLPIIHMGTDDQKKRFLTRFTGPEARLGALCLTEPDAGSDVANISTTATKEGKHWVLNGVKRFITNGGIADIHVVFATVDKSLGYFGIRGFVVEHDTKGLKTGKVEDKMGVRASHTAEVILDDSLLWSDEDPGNIPTLGRLRCGWHRPGRVRIRARVQPAAEGLRRPDRQEAGDRVHARGHADEDRCGSAPHLARGGDGRPRAPDEQGGEHGQVVRRRHGDGSHHGRGADPRRRGLHERRAGREVDAGRQDLPDLGGDISDPAGGHLPRRDRGALGLPGDDFRFPRRFRE